MDSNLGNKLRIILVPVEQGKPISQVFLFNSLTPRNDWWVASTSPQYVHVIFQKEKLIKQTYISG